MREDAESEFDREDIAAYAALGGVTMSKTTTVVAAAMAAALTVASFQPAAATNNGLSEKQVRAIVKEAVAKTRPGKDGRPILSAHIFSTGRVDDSTPGGITQENVRRVDVGDNLVVYCFSGLPPVVGGVGGQVTLDGLQASGVGLTPHIALLDAPDCNPEVSIVGPNGSQAFDFHVLLY
jgi:hypothetical protein